MTPFGAIVLHWSGGLWTEVSSPATNFIYSVWGSGANDVWAVGEFPGSLHWTGGTWTNVGTPTSKILNGIWGSGPGDVWAVGGGGTILHYQ